MAVLLLVACAPQVSQSPVPTLTLISVTETPTSVPVTALPTATFPSLLSPEDVVTPTSERIEVAIPIEAQGIVELSIIHLAEQLEIQPGSIELVEVDAATWRNADLGCGDGRVTPSDDLLVDGFYLTLAYAGRFYGYHTDSDTVVRQCGNGQSSNSINVEFLLERDPIAAELVLLAQSQLARQLDLATQRVRVIDVMPYIWPDGSLGCPLEDQAYTRVDTPGYRILLEAGDDQYLFHSDSERLLPCDLTDEVLPG